ncbi:MAG: SH3 domain-containing protein [Rhizomicrobium sp.]
MMIQGAGARIFGVVIALSVAGPACAAVPGPAFMSLARDKVYLREGPSYQHRVLWIFRRKDLPVKVLQSYDIWRRVRSPDGTTGWISRVMLSDRRTIVVTARRAAPIRDGAGAGAHVIAFAQHGVVAKLDACKATVCRISADGTEGWIAKQNIGGVGVGEVFQ